MSARLSGRKLGPAAFNPHNNSISQSSSLRVPKVTPDLIEYLNTVFPDRISLVEQGSLERAQGARSVVNHLIGLLSTQEK